MSNKIITGAATSHKRLERLCVNSVQLVHHARIVVVKHIIYDFLYSRCTYSKKKI